MEPHMRRASRNLLLIAVAALTLAACGKRGALETPKPAADAPVYTNPDGTPSKSGRPFVLDPLVR
jgi:predicted small lipoprotein YifL